VDFIEPIVDIAMRSTERVKRLANSLLDINRLESGQPIVDLKEVRIQRLVNDALETVKHTADAKSLQIEHHIPDGLPSVFVDEEMIRRVLINLLENAVKFTPTRGRILVAADASEASLHLCVQDSGIGIPEEARDRIFDKFTRIRMENVPRGIGLGLAFCRLAMEAHGGRIWVEPNEPQGSKFCFILPVKEPFD
jgi:signal transduction histidine kinase